MTFVLILVGISYINADIMPIHIVEDIHLKQKSLGQFGYNY